MMIWSCSLLQRNLHGRIVMPKKLYKAGGGLAPNPVKNIAPKAAVHAKGTPMNPITKMKLTNGIPGFKRGGQIK